MKQWGGPYVDPHEMLPEGTLVDARYRVGRFLGRGGMGSVYEALDVRLRRRVALKVLASSLASAKNLALRFEREARATAQLDHPGCVRLYDYGRAVGGHYLVIELLDGPSLAGLIAQRGRLLPLKAIAIARELAVALDHAHRRGVLHRDVKPGNVVYTTRAGRMRPVLIDFGLAALHDEQPLTAAGVCAGTPAYVAPERLRGERYDARADIYSLGVVLHEMVAGEKPFVAESAIDVARMQLTRAPTPLRQLVPGVTPALESVVLRALEKDPGRRFTGAEHLIAALDGVALVQRGPAVSRPRAS